MKWRPGGRSGSLDDRRSSGGPRGGLGGLPLGRGGGLAGLLIFVVVAVLGGGNVLGGGDGGGGVAIDDPFERFPAGPAAQGSDREVAGSPDPEEKLVDFMSFVIDDIQSFWERDFAAAGRSYPRTTLVLFRSGVRTGCGAASSATGPFYCPEDRKVYVDLGFFRDLSDRFRAPGDFAQAYVVAHEVGHHIQTVTGVSQSVGRATSQDPGRRNDLSIRQELQADCLAGVWAHSTYERGILESGDLDEGLDAASAVGDDRIQRESTGQVNPETWTHGSSEQRKSWFRRGFDSGDAERCDTFAAAA